MTLREYERDLDRRWEAHLRELHPQHALNLNEVERSFVACRIVYGNFPGTENVDLLGKMAGEFVDDESLDPESMTDVCVAWARASGKSFFSLLCEAA